MAEQKKKTRRTYQAEILGLPPLKMILVHAENDRANAAAKPGAKSKSKRSRSEHEAVLKIIEHLTKIK
jgi:hypothetical protein